MTAEKSSRGIGIFVMTLSALALAGPFLLALLVWGSDQVGPLLLSGSTYSVHSQTSVSVSDGLIPFPVFVGAYILAFVAAFGWGFNLTRKGR